LLEGIEIEAGVEIITTKRQANASAKAICDRYLPLEPQKRKAQEDVTVQIQREHEAKKGLIASLKES
jgi:hypothetical protein